MKSFIIFCIGFIFLSTSASFSQFVITSSVPSDGAVSVPLSTTISFTFSAPLDTTMRYGELQFPISFIATDPLDTLVFGAISYSTDLQTISFEITHTANTDFVWLVIGARNNTGQPLSQPYVLNYTTSAAYGANRVSGTVTFEGGDPTNAVVVLTDGPLFGEEEGIALIGAIVPNSLGAYIANYVRDGVYWPITAKDIDGDGEIDPMGNDVIGFYDPNHDGQPDSIVVSGSDLTGVDMTLRRLFVPVTARAYVDTATSIAKQYAADQELKVIGVHADPKGIDVGLDGTALMWWYQFYSPSFQLSTLVLVSSFFTMADTTMEGFPSTGLPIPENFVDSDSAMSLAVANGGHDFEVQHNVVRRTLYGGNYWADRFLQDSTKIIWVAEYEAIEPDSSSLIFRVFVDMITGELITGVQEPRVSVPLGYSLSQNYPNPFNPTTTINYSVPKQSFVTIKIYDALGREVSILVNEEKSVGTYSVEFNASGISSGVYFYQIKTNEFVQTKKMLLLR
ncbi:MAG: hypothetical protein A2455_07335 [Ignavibacteria bacterium RIFOXYC2_FULL_35_16]|nr:MAG: hypothetical protein A2X60_07345 [Ignavibacteria bacterium GWF2_35_20]OGU84524.1 MAG: hypothetical protein A3K31_08860 [Ignavibacteria bacterium RIFOXYA12_FULL_35_25]OGU92048.1 MAG: hypothetical protein A2492_01320 [Ignavibacteria bacterium RIFOXYC12_FULL_35_11]OGU95646.1 MAG: hypothetical protein A2347_00410 [Ignavibacteria bacterium RIFOXYB12_FULL_35_14]OGU99100.1 MAG: hypothetical protein A2455_07335 [Ignavibacteria bacterium RIFOXYC2_FULL_35_16]OGV33015.1 MAG: hypothetical protein 